MNEGPPACRIQETEIGGELQIDEEELMAFKEMDKGMQVLVTSFTLSRPARTTMSAQETTPLHACSRAALIWSIKFRALCRMVLFGTSFSSEPLEFLRRIDASHP